MSFFVGANFIVSKSDVFLNCTIYIIKAIFDDKMESACLYIKIADFFECFFYEIFPTDTDIYFGFFRIKIIFKLALRKTTDVRILDFI